MAFKFIHFSDTHLGFSDLDLLDENEKLNIREEDVYNSFKQVIDYAIDCKIDFLIHSGDIFHRSSPTNRAVVFLAEQLKRLEDNNIPIYIIAGNHDFPKTIYSIPIHNIFTILTNCRIFFDEKYSVYETDLVNLHLLPHINSEEKYKEEVSKIEALNNGKPNIFVTHVSMPNYLMDEYGERTFPIEQIEKLEVFDYVALGHWHKYKHLKSFGNVYYSGSTERMSDKENDYDKLFLECTWDNKISVQAHKLNIRLIKNIKVKECYKKTKNEIIEEIKESLKGLDIKGGVFNIYLNEIDQIKVYDIRREDIDELVKEALYFKIVKSVKDSDSIFVADKESFDLRSFLNEELRKSFQDDDEYTLVSKLTGEIIDKIEEEESDEDK